MLTKVFSHINNGFVYSSKDNRYLVDWHRFTVPYGFRAKIIHNEFVSHAGNPIDGVRILNFSQHFHSAILKIIAALDMTYYRHLTHEAAQRRLQYIFNNFIQEPFGNQGYNAQFAHLNVKINYNRPFSKKRSMITPTKDAWSDFPINRADMGIMVDISGQGCRDLDSVFNQTNTNWGKHLRELKKLLPNEHEDRIDINYDIFDAPKSIKYRITPKAILKQAKFYHIKSKATRLKFTGSIKLKGGKDTGLTTYLANHSFRLLRIYNKWEERKYHHHENWRSKKGYWIRWEFENKSTYSRNIAKLIAKGVGINTIFYSELDKELKIGTTRYWISKNGKHHHKFQVYRWWYLFSHQSFAKPVYFASNEDPELDTLNGSNHFKQLVKIRGPKNISTHFLKTNAWIDHSVAKSLVSELVAYCNLGGNPSSLLNHILQEGKIRVKRDPNGYKRIMQLQFAATDIARNSNSDEVTKALTNWIKDFNLDDTKKDGFRMVKQRNKNIKVHLTKNIIRPIIQEIYLNKISEDHKNNFIRKDY